MKEAHQCPVLSMFAYYVCTYICIYVLLKKICVEFYSVMYSMHNAICLVCDLLPFYSQYTTIFLFVFLFIMQSPRSTRSNARSPRSDASDGRRRQAGSERTSPVRELEEFEDETELLGDGEGSVRPEEEEEGEGEELFGDNMEA